MLELSARFSDAVDYARRAHEGQVRKGTRIPYVQHPLAVSALVIEHGGDEDQAIAALLHDVLEDCGHAHADTIRERFGEAVLAIVEGCTDGSAEAKEAAAQDLDPVLAWRRRKLEYLASLQHKPAAVLLVSACDKLHNAGCILNDLRSSDDPLQVFERFTAGRDGTLRYYASLSRVIKAREVSPAERLRETVDAMHILAGVAQPPGLEDAA